MELPECTVCCEQYNKSNRKECICPMGCGSSVCRQCLLTYLTGESVVEYVCMGCKKPYTYEHLLQLLPRTKVDNDLAKHRQDVLFETEKARLVEAQAHMEHLTKKNKDKERVKVLTAKIKKHRDRIKILTEEKRRILYGEVTAAYKEEEIEGTVANRPCPLDGCRGFLGSKWRCGTCNKKVCKRCMCEKDEDHECDPDEVANVRAVRRDSKPCPSCGTRISRTEGCSQMWCIVCKQAFNWNTGNLIKGHVHNPHYHEWRARGQATDADVCREGMPPIRYGALAKHMITLRVVNFMQQLEDMYANVTVRYQVHRNKYLELGAKYLRKDVAEEEYKIKLHRLIRREEFNTEVRQLTEMYRECSRGILWRLHDALGKDDSKVCQDIYHELYKLRLYVNRHLDGINERWRWQVPSTYYMPRALAEARDIAVTHPNGGGLAIRNPCKGVPYIIHYTEKQHHYIEENYQEIILLDSGDNESHIFVLNGEKVYCDQSNGPKYQPFHIDLDKKGILHIKFRHSW